METFSPLTKYKKALPREECLAILRGEKRGVLCVVGEEGYPYGSPLNHWYEEEEDCLYFHCGRYGHRLRALASCDKASFCVVDKGRPTPGDWAETFRSVIVFGRVQVVDDPGEVTRITRRLCGKFTHDQGYIEEEIRKYLKATLLLRMDIRHMTGKWVVES